MKETEFYQPKAITYLTFDSAASHATEFGDCGLTRDTVVELNYFLDEFLSQLVRTGGYELVDIEQLCTSISFQFAFNSLGSRCVEEGRKVMKGEHTAQPSSTQNTAKLRLPGQDKLILDVLRGVCANEPLELVSVESFCLSESVRKFLKVVVITLGQYIVHSMVLMTGKSHGEFLSTEDLYKTLCQDDQLKGMFSRMRTKRRLEEYLEKSKLSSTERIGRLRSSSAPSKRSTLENLASELPESVQMDTKSKGLGKILRSIRDNVHISHHSSDQHHFNPRATEDLHEATAKPAKQTPQQRQQKMVDFDMLLNSNQTIKLSLTPARLESMEKASRRQSSQSMSSIRHSTHVESLHSRLSGEGCALLGSSLNAAKPPIMPSPKIIEANCEKQNYGHRRAFSYEPTFLISK
ncbi:hypothetical protein K493DRAFT_340777 [Basidiobolus meristosporus CBS 931.73]|uniref:Uncharacterized protein n=1 Tax=Basidiobolus meristosporus CBS 931.73 TaxID=1314790 RepID=A0A1Y1XU30_9FUNG|nr:hypothetical protein K493DRAFT_340777 [Basidiobolus meristosporus CBS 931.73]|eukprot:ORX89248.1 hypothetical protein K493DRAFT_340777 [Basidiobolus meristosporus CBS 931.73]